MLGSPLAPGAMAELHHVARDGVPGVCKRIRADQRTNPAFRSLLAIEAEALRRVRHDAAIRLLDAGCGWLVLERAEHPVDVHPPTDEPGLAGLLHRLLEVLDAAHGQGIVHRDVKASNVLWTARGWVLADWGAARIDGIPDPAPGVGPIEAMPPERLAGGPATPETDRYAVGVLGWQLATGALPFPERRWEALLASHARGLPPFRPQFDVSRGFEDRIRELLLPVV